MKRIEIPQTKITLKNKTEFVVDNEMGEKIKQAWANGSETISFNGTMIACSMIAMIEPIVEYRENYLLDIPDSHLLNEPETKSDGSGYKKFRQQYERLFGRKLKKRATDDK